MDIPIQNIYFLLCYAWNKLEEKDIVTVTADEQHNMLELFAKVLTGGMSYLFRKGLDRGYQLKNEELRTIRGKIDFNTTTKKNLYQYAKVQCSYDELSYSVLHNQIIKSTIHGLIKCNDVDDSIKDDLLLIYRKLYDINEIVLHKKHFSLVQLHRNNYFYDFLIKICELIYDNMFIDENTGKSKFKDFIKDEVQMRHLFEEFVRNFYKREQSTYDVHSDIIKWDAIPMDNESQKVLPEMHTDISLTSKERKIVIDTKYYRQALDKYYNKEILRSANLYQLFSYLINIEKLGGQNIDCEGILLYPTVETDLDYKYKIRGHNVIVKTINLNQNWKNIHKDLLNIIN